MQVHGDYWQAGYAHLEGLIPVAVAQQFLAQLREDIDRTRIPLRGLARPGMMLRRPAVEVYGYQHKPMLGLLWGLTPTMSALTGRELLPTYSYFRIYRSTDVCWIHSDRFACEHSLSLTLAYSDDVTWPFDIGTERIVTVAPAANDFDGAPYATIEMRPGDAVLYQGVQFRHGRLKPNPNRWSAHMFLHWVDATGPYRNEAFDRRALDAKVDFDWA